MGCEKDKCGFFGKKDDSGRELMISTPGNPGFPRKMVVHPRCPECQAIPSWQTPPKPASPAPATPSTVAEIGKEAMADAQAALDEGRKLLDDAYYFRK